MSSLGLGGVLFGLLQQDTGENMINLIGPVEILAGDALDLVLTVTDDEDARESLTGLAGDDIRVRIGSTLGGAALLELIIGSGITLLDQTADSATEGQAAIALTEEQTAQTPAMYWLEVTVKLGGKRKHVIEPRELTIKAGIAAVPA